MAAPSAGIIDQCAFFGDDRTRVGEITVEVAMQRRMIEIEQLALERADLPAEVFVERGRAAGDVCERHAG
jgi:hypothetical protein